MSVDGVSPLPYIPSHFKLGVSGQLLGLLTHARVTVAVCLREALNLGNTILGSPKEKNPNPQTFSECSPAEP